MNLGSSKHYNQIWLAFVIKQSHNLRSYVLGLILAIFEVNNRQRLLTELQKNPSYYVPAIISSEALRTAHDCRISACELAPQLFATSGDLMTTMYLSAPLSCICLHRSLVFVCIAVLYLLFQCCLPRTVVEIAGWRQSYNKPLSTTPLSLLR